jgi:hypothetical protein
MFKEECICNAQSDCASNPKFLEIGGRGSRRRRKNNLKEEKKQNKKKQIRHTANTKKEEETYRQGTWIRKKETKNRAEQREDIEIFAYLCRRKLHQERQKIKFI